MKPLLTSAALALALAASPAWAGDALVAARGQGTIVTVNQIAEATARATLNRGGSLFFAENGATLVLDDMKLVDNTGRVCPADFGSLTCVK